METTGFAVLKKPENPTPEQVRMFNELVETVKSVRYASGLCIYEINKVDCVLTCVDYHLLEAEFYPIDVTDDAGAGAGNKITKRYN